MRVCLHVKSRCEVPKSIWVEPSKPPPWIDIALIFPQQSCSNRRIMESSPVLARYRRAYIFQDSKDDTVRRMRWTSAPSCLFLVYKPGVEAIEECVTRQLRPWALSNNIEVVTNPERLSDCDFTVSIGGDGTLLYASHMTSPPPPVVAFAMGSLGFLTRHTPDFLASTLDRFIAEGAVVSARARMAVRPLSKRAGRGTVVPPVGHHPPSRCPAAMSQFPPPAALPSSSPSAPSISGGTVEHPSHVHEKSHKGSPLCYSLNEVAVLRQGAGQLAILDVCVDGVVLPPLHADGAIVATPTGSTAYSLSAGGPICHPGVNGMILTPVNSHSLGSRPMLLSERSCITITVREDSRAGGTLAIDGFGCGDLEPGMGVKVCRADEGPMWFVCANSETDDFVSSLKDRLLWNARGEPARMLPAKL